MENEENKPAENANESSEKKTSFDIETWLKDITSRLDRMESNSKPTEQPKSEPVKTEPPTVTSEQANAVEPDSDFDNYCKIHFDHKEIK